MEDLPFYANLSEVQKEYASKIAAKAKEAGVSPKLAISIAYQESKLNPKIGRGSAGEIGIMQIKPNTAKEVGFSIEDLADPDKNIEAGLKYLKKSLDMSDGNEKLAAAGYNAGIYHPFFSSKGANLPPTTVSYLKNLNSYGAFAEPKTEVTVEEPGQTLDSVETQRAMEERGEQIERERGQAAGAGAGALISTAKAVPAAFKGVGRAIGKRIEEGKLAADIKAGMTQPPLGGSLAPGLAEQATATNRILQGTTDPLSGTTGRARMGGFNLETAQQAARAREMAQNIGQLQQRGVVAQTPDQLLAKAPGMTATPSGVAYPRASAPSPVATPAKSGLDEVTNLFRKMIEPGSRLRSIGATAFKYGAPPLALYQAGGEFASMASELGKEKPDYAKAALSGIGGIGSTLSAFTPTAPIGLPLAIGAPAIQSLREQERRTTVPTEYNPMGDIVSP